jgi:hypothetical protein
MQYEVNIGAHITAYIRVTNISLDESEASPRSPPHLRENVFQIRPMSSRKIVDANDSLSEPEQLLYQIRSNKASTSCY